MLTYNELKKKPKEFLAATSHTVEEFECLLPGFNQCYQQKYRTLTVAGKARQRQAGGGNKGTLASIEDKLLFILVYQKTYPLQTMQGLHFDLSQPSANEWIHRLLPILQEALSTMGMTPERDGAALAESEWFNELSADLLLDGSERRRQRPQDKQEQKDHYSGKKKAHTDKNLLISHAESGQVLYLSPTEPGRTHDKKLADEQAITYPSGATVGKDTGFQGYEPKAVLTYQPQKKPKGKELTTEDLFLNQVIASFRIGVEHVIAGVKRCRIVKDTFRNLKDDFSDLAMEVACALHNLRIACRRPHPALNLLTFCT
jgi:DDE superfamily endonuclease/Helix-turn-helix of DDE superfamily endonuclease